MKGNVAKIRMILSATACWLVMIGCSGSPLGYVEKGNALTADGKYADASLNYRKAIQKDAKFVEAHYRLGLSEIKQGKFREGLAALNQASQLAPERSDITVSLADATLNAYLGSGRTSTRLYEQLKSISERLLKADPNSYDGLRIEGQLAVLNGKPDLAVEAFRRANQSKPMQPDTVLALAGALLQNNQSEEAEVVAQSLIQFDKTNGGAYDLLYKLYQSTKRPAEAEELIKTKVRNNPIEGRYWLELAAHYVSAGKSAEAMAALRHLLDDPKTFPQAHLLVGDFYSGSGNLPQALLQYEEGAKANSPDLILYQKRKVGVLMAQRKIDEALATVDAILKQQPQDEETLRVRAGLLLDSGKPENIDAAIAGFQSLLNKKPTEEGLRFQLGRAYQAKGDREAARAQFLQAGKRPTYLAPRFALAELSLQGRHYEEALRYTDEILVYDTQNPSVRLLRSSALRLAGKFSEARRELTRLVKDYPNNPDAQLQMGLLDLSEKRYREAEAIFLKLYKPGQANIGPLAGLAETYAAQNQKEKVIQLLTEELKKSPKSAEVRAALGDAAAANGNITFAIEQYRQAVAIDATTAVFRLRLGELYAANGENDQAAASFVKAAELAPKDTAPVIALAALLESTGRLEESKTHYQRAVTLNPEDPVALNNLAYILAESGDAASALPLIERALKKLPDNPHLSDTLGYVYLGKKMEDSAIQVFHQLVTKDPQNPQYRLHLAMALMSKGDTPKAKNELQTALASSPSKTQERKIREMLAKIG